MNEKIKIGLLGVIAIALIANAYLLSTDRGPISNPSDSKATFERTSGNSAAVSDEATARRKAMEQANSVDPMKTRKDASKASNLPATTISFADNAHDFGTIQQDSENKKIFTFTNEGNEPLIIEKAKGSCGCTVPTYPKEPIPPGGTGEIEVVYKPGKQKSKQTKNVTITANTTPPNTVLTISANVLENAAG
ncbi:MAG: DUF1573 domain-containing protein [Flavobacteriales bacterium]|nr:DUF1573 domain-containing protein [Flavobacteriales bacterium]